MMTEGKKKPEEKNAHPPGSERSLRDAAEKKPASIPKNSPVIKGPATEHLVHELQVHLKEIETITKDILKSSESRYRRFFEAVRDGILIIDAGTGTILDVNPFLIELLGFTHEQFLGKKLWEIGVFKDIAASKDNFKELQEKKYIHFENLPLETADGRQIYAEFVSFVYEVDHENLMQCNIRDITKRIQVEETLRETTGYLQNLFDYGDAPIITWDPGFQILRFNHAFERLTGRKQEEMQGKTLDSLFPDETRQSSIILIQKTLKGERMESMEIPILNTDGSIKTVLWNSANVLDLSGKFIATIAQGFNITERKRMEADLKSHAEKLEEIVSERTRELREAQDQLVTKEKLAILGKLAGGVGHELRNPLGAIKNAAYFLNLALETPDPDVKEMVELINKEVARSEDIISSLLDFARPKTLTLTKEAFTAAVNGALIRNPVPDRVTVINNLDETLPRIPADQDKLLQVFNNIISNAFQAMPEGGSLTITSKQPDPEWVSISFTDTGEGISAENMKKLFEPLFTTKITGIGLGLVVSKTIVELHGGHIDVRSKAGKGTTVTVNLPMSGHKGGMK
jgi:two-component system cell cycle sensor histidine kinase/response regulator CckA